MIKFSHRRSQFFFKCYELFGKMPNLTMTKNPSKKFLFPDPGADDFQNSLLSTDTSLVKFSCRPELLTDRLKSKQTNST